MDKPIIIGIAGRARTGKSTAAGYLQAMAGGQEWAVDESRKDEPAFCGLPVSPRELWQRLGDWGREVHPDFWVRAAMARWGALRASIAVDDVVIANEGALDTLFRKLDIVMMDRALSDLPIA